MCPNGVSNPCVLALKLGHTNVQTSRTAIRETLSHLGPDPLPPLPALDPSTESDSESEDEEAPDTEPVVNWHNDSYREILAPADHLLSTTDRRWRLSSMGMRGHAV